jgi:hypothetical protein
MGTTTERTPQKCEALSEFTDLFLKFHPRRGIYSPCNVFLAETVFMKCTERQGLSYQTTASLKHASAFSIIRFAIVGSISQNKWTVFTVGGAVTDNSRRYTHAH